MKRVALCLSVACFCVLFISCPYNYSNRKVPIGNRKAVVYLHVLKEDGCPFEDSFAKDFMLDYYAKYSHEREQIVINEKDELIFKCSEFYINYEKDEPTEEEITRALDGGYWFAIKDTTGKYKTVKKTYKETYKSYEKTFDKGDNYSNSGYIYHCEIKMEKK